MHCASLPDIVYVDDGACCIEASSPSQLRSRIPFGATLIFRSYRKFGVSLHVALTKTVCTLVVRGKGAKYARQDMFHQSAGLIEFESNDDPLQFPVVRPYTQLGASFVLVAVYTRGFLIDVPRLPRLTSGLVIG